VRERNQYVEDKFREISERNREEYLKKIMKFEHDEETKNKKLKKLYTNMHKMWTDFKQTNQNAMDMLTIRQREEETARKEKAEEMMAKLARSQKAVENFMKEQAHKNML
jgi:RNA processing factor Prp31